MQHVAVMDRGHLVTTGTVNQLIGAARASTWRWTTSRRPDRCWQSLRASRAVQPEPPGLTVALNGVQRKDIVAALVHAGVGVETITSRHRLEDAFLQMLATEGRAMIGVELRKQVWRLRTYLALGIMVAIPVITTLAFKLSGGPQGAERRSSTCFDLGTRSGLNMPIDSLLVMTGFLLPVVVSSVCRRRHRRRGELGQPCAISSSGPYPAAAC